ncbi:hypothetical protein OKW42_008290 [Paraburkholderia sp. WC7.3d]
MADATSGTTVHQDYSRDPYWSSTRSVEDLPLGDIRKSSSWTPACAQGYPAVVLLKDAIMKTIKRAVRRSVWVPALVTTSFA